MLEDGAVDREEDDVGRGHIEGNTEDPLEGHVDRADEPGDAVTAMRDEIQADAIEQRSGHGIDEEQQRGNRKHPSCRAPCRFEDDEKCDAPRRDVDDVWRCRAIDKGVDVAERPCERGHYQHDPESVPQRMHPGRSRRVGDDRQHERDEQEADPIDVRIDDADGPVQRVGRQRKPEYEAGSAARVRAARQTRGVVHYCAVHTFRSR